MHQLLLDLCLVNLDLKWVTNLRKIPNKGYTYNAKRWRNKDWKRLHKWKKSCLSFIWCLSKMINCQKKNSTNVIISWKNIRVIWMRRKSACINMIVVITTTIVQNIIMPCLTSPVQKMRKSMNAAKTVEEIF